MAALAAAGGGADLARALMVQGTASHVGKSWLCAGLCRLLRQDGWRVAPFKAQNMSNNAAVTPDGGEIGRAQALQARACGLAPATAMNPVLLKPTGDASAQVILHGRSVGVYPARAYHRDPSSIRDLAWEAVRAAWSRLASAYEVVVIEGAGSPAEVNLRPYDIANMRVATLADAPVLLVADIDRGGVFAAVIGTLDLLPGDERRRVRGIVINRFRGDPALFADGVRFLEARAGVPVLGIVPWLDLRLPEEDGQALSERRPADQKAEVDIVVVAIPRISNFTDFDALARTPGVRVRYVEKPEDAAGADAVILPGSKNTFADLRWLRERAWEPVLARAPVVVGLCGGFQMLGSSLADPLGVEDGRPQAEPGLGLIDATTVFQGRKRARQTVARDLATDEPLHGYEIHAGETQLGTGARPFLAGVDSAASPDGRVLGTYLHGLFDNDGFRLRWVNRLRLAKGLPPLRDAGTDDVDRALDLLAATLRRHLDVEGIYRLLEPAP